MQAIFETFSIYDFLWYFLLYAFLGWCLEVVFCSVNTGHFVNRGFLNGPLCPIYGFGAVIVVLLLSPLVHLLLPLYLGSVLLTSLLELLTGWLLMKLFHTRWWDYSDQPFNLGGYICLKFSLLWGIACVVLMRGIHPLLADLVALLPVWLGWTILAVLYTCLLADLVVTVAGIAKLNRDLGEMTKIAERLHQTSETVAKSLGGRAVDAAQMLAEMKTSLAEAKAEAEAALPPQTEAPAGTPAEEVARLRRQFQVLAEEQRYVRKRLLKAFPDMRSLRYGDALAHLLHLQSKDIAQDKNAAPDAGAPQDGNGTPALPQPDADALPGSADSHSNAVSPPATASATGIPNQAKSVTPPANDAESAIPSDAPQPSSPAGK